MSTVILDFHPDFESILQLGMKPHTIRRKRQDGLDPLPGDDLQLYVGVGTVHQRLVRSEVCDYAVDVTIWPSLGNLHRITVAGRNELTQAEIEQFAQRDGFMNSEEMIYYFRERYGLPFNGVLIGWEPYLKIFTRH